VRIAVSEDRERRWRLAIGGEDEFLDTEERRLSAALTALYGEGARDGEPGDDRRKRRAGLGGSVPNLARWLGDIRRYFPAPVVQIVQKDAFERLDLRRMLLQPEFLVAVEADIDLVTSLMALRHLIPDKARATARRIIAKLVAQLTERLERRTALALRGAVDRTQRTAHPRFADIDWPRTIRANLQHYQEHHRTIVAERLIGFLRRQRRLVDLDEIILCVDQSGSMASSVVYASIFAAVMASLPVVRTRLVAFDTAVLDLTEELADPVEILFGIQLGGGTDINQAVAYCADRIERPGKAHFVLISDLFEGGDEAAVVARLATLIRQGVNVIVLLALSDVGHPAYDTKLAARIAALGAPVFACTPDQFPRLMAAALRRNDLHAWAAKEDIKLVRPAE
jgi:Mg-chelatase subunit ChlD